jgi:hypothetical protein
MSPRAHSMMRNRRARGGMKKIDQATPIHEIMQAMIDREPGLYLALSDYLSKRSKRGGRVNPQQLRDSKEVFDADL